MSRPRGAGKGIEFLREHLADEDGPCLIWPMAQDTHGYGMLGNEGKHYKAHSLMCELVHGPRPGPNYQASHSCNNGHLACVHPRHISWETRRDNHLRRRANGTHATNRYGRNGGMTIEQAVEILRMKDNHSQPQIARRFNVSLPTVRNVFKGKTRIARAAAAMLAA